MRPRSPMAAPKIGDTVHVEGCHRNYRPVLISVAGGVGTVRTFKTNPATEKAWPFERLRVAAEWDARQKGRRRSD